MQETLKQLHNVIDEKIEDISPWCSADREEPAEKSLKYYAADVVASVYDGPYRDGLACACQCFLNARLMHKEPDDLDALKVLLGDFYMGQIPSFDLPKEASYELLDRFAAFVEEETAGGRDYAEFDLKRYETLFREAAEVLYE